MKTLPTRTTLLTFIATACLLFAALGCADESEDTSGGARVGEICARNSDCIEGLLCNGIELRCVKLCALNSDECGEGITCEAADDGTIGFCPLPPL